MSVQHRLTTRDVEERTRFAATLAAAATKVADEARKVRDTGIEELLRQGERPAHVARVAGLASSQLARYTPAIKPPFPAKIADQAQAVVDATKLLDEITSPEDG